MLQLRDKNDDDDNSSEFEFIMARIRNHETAPLTPVPAWLPWVSWSGRHGKQGLLGNGEGGDDDESEDDNLKVPASKRRTILFSVSTVNHERIERTTLPPETGSAEMTLFNRVSASKAEEESLWDKFSFTGIFHS